MHKRMLQLTGSLKEVCHDPTESLARGSGKHAILTMTPNNHQRAVGIRRMHSSAAEECFLVIYIVISVAIYGCLLARLRRR